MTFQGFLFKHRPQILAIFIPFQYEDPETVDTLKMKIEELTSKNQQLQSENNVTCQFKKVIRLYSKEAGKQVVLMSNRIHALRVFVKPMLNVLLILAGFILCNFYVCLSLAILDVPSATVVSANQTCRIPYANLYPQAIDTQPFLDNNVQYDDSCRFCLWWVLLAAFSCFVMGLSSWCIAKKYDQCQQVVKGLQINLRQHIMFMLLFALAMLSIYVTPLLTIVAILVSLAFRFCYASVINKPVTLLMTGKMSNIPYIRFSVTSCIMSLLTVACFLLGQSVEDKAAQYMQDNFGRYILNMNHSKFYAQSKQCPIH